MANKRGQERWTLVVEHHEIVGFYAGTNRVWLGTPRMGGYEEVEVMPVSEHEAVLSEVRKENE